MCYTSLQSNVNLQQIVWGDRRCTTLKENAWKCRKNHGFMPLTYFSKNIALHEPLNCKVLTWAQFSRAETFQTTWEKTDCSWCKTLASYYSSYKKRKVLVMLVSKRLNFGQLSVAVGLEMASTSWVKGEHQAGARETSDGSKRGQKLGSKSRNWKIHGMSDAGCRTWLLGRYWEKLAACPVQMKEQFSFVKFSLFPSNWILSHSPSVRFIPILSGMPVAHSPRDPVLLPGCLLVFAVAVALHAQTHAKTQHDGTCKTCSQNQRNSLENTEGWEQQSSPGVKEDLSDRESISSAFTISGARQRQKQHLPGQKTKCRNSIFSKTKCILDFLLSLVHIGRCRVIPFFIRL